jgi:hypothetical protein
MATNERDLLTANNLDDELALTERVGRELVRRGLREHVARARQYYAALKAGRTSDAWSHAMNIEWLRLLRLPPHEDHYPVRPRMSGCEKCRGVGGLFTVTIFPGGSKSQCGGCGLQWLELD